MATVNKIILLGNLVADPELRNTTTGKQVASFRIAVDSGIGENKKTLFLNGTIWGTQAENLVKYKTKGEQIYVEGELREESWEDKDSGEKKTKIVINADRIQFVGSKKESSESQEEQPKPVAKKKSTSSSKKEDDDIF